MCPWPFPGGSTSETANFLAHSALHTVLQHYPRRVCTLKCILTCHCLLQTILSKGFMLWKHHPDGQQRSPRIISKTWNFSTHKGWSRCFKAPIGSTIQSRRNARPSAVQHGFHQVVSFGLRPVLFSMNCNISLAIQIQLKTTFMNSVFYMKARKGNGPSSLWCTHWVLASPFSKVEEAIWEELYKCTDLWTDL